MKQSDYVRWTRQRRKVRNNLSSSKGKAYSDSGDRMENFKARAALLGLSPELVILTDMSKHFHRLVRFAKGAVIDTDGIHSRIDDLIVYSELFDALVGFREGDYDKTDRIT